MRLLLLWLALAMTAIGCASLAPVGPGPRCVDVDADLCDAAWQLAQPRLLREDGQIEDAVVGLSGPVAECVPAECMEMAVTVYYPSGVVHEVQLRVTGGLRVVGTQRSEYAAPPAPPEPSGQQPTPVE